MDNKERLWLNLVERGRAPEREVFETIWRISRQDEMFSLGDAGINRMVDYHLGVTRKKIRIPVAISSGVSP